MKRRSPGRGIGAFEPSHDVNPVFVMIKSTEIRVDLLKKTIQRVLTGMSKGGMANVVRKRSRLNQVARYKPKLVPIVEASCMTWMVCAQTSDVIGRRVQLETVASCGRGAAMLETRGRGHGLAGTRL